MVKNKTVVLLSLLLFELQVLSKCIWRPLEEVQGRTMFRVRVCVAC